MAEWPDAYDVLLRRHCRLPRDGPPIDPDALLSTLGLDSIEVVEFILAIEDTFDLAIPQQSLVPEVFATPASVWRMIAGLRLPESTR